MCFSIFQFEMRNPLKGMTTTEMGVESLQDLILQLTNLTSQERKKNLIPEMSEWFVDNSHPSNETSSNQIDIHLLKQFLNLFNRKQLKHIADICVERYAQVQFEFDTSVTDNIELLRNWLVDMIIEQKKKLCKTQESLNVIIKNTKRWVGTLTSEALILEVKNFIGYEKNNRVEIITEVLTKKNNKQYLAKLNMTLLELNTSSRRNMKQFRETVKLKYKSQHNDTDEYIGIKAYDKRLALSKYRYEYKQVDLIKNTTSDIVNENLFSRNESESSGIKMSKRLKKNCTAPHNNFTYMTNTYIKKNSSFFQERLRTSANVRLKDFQSLGLSDDVLLGLYTVLENSKHSKYVNDTEPIRATEIQRISIQKIYQSNKNIILGAETGSGKTLAYLLPIVQKLKYQVI